MKNLLILVTMLFHLFPFPHQSIKITTSAQTLTPSLVLTGHFGGTTNVVTRSGNYVYMGQGNYLSILDISSLNAPMQVAKLSLFTHSEISDIKLVGNLLYITAPIGGLKIVDVTNPLNPNLVGSYSFSSSNAKAVFVSGNYAFIAYNTLIKVVRISNPASPLEVSQWIGGANDLVVVNTKIYTISDTKFSILDATSLGNITEIGSVSFTKDDIPGGFGKSIKVIGNYAYIARAGNALKGSVQIFDISNPNAIVPKGYIIGGDPYRLSVLGNYAYVSGTDGFRVIDVSNVDSPQLKHHNPLESAFGVDRDGIYGQGIFADSQNVFITVKTGGLFTFDISHPLLPVQVSSYKTFNQIKTLAVKGDYIYLVPNPISTELAIINITELTRPKIEKMLPIHSTEKIKIIGNYAYFASMDASNNYYDVRIFDLSNAPNITEVKHLIIGDTITDVIANGSHLYILGKNGKIKIYDNTNPSDPLFLNDFWLSYMELGEMEVRGEFGYIAFRDKNGVSGGVVVVDLSNPRYPFKINQIGTVYYPYTPTNPWQTHVKFLHIADQFLFAGGSDGCFIFNLSDPIDITVETTQSITCGPMETGGDFTYLGYATQSSSGVRVYEGATQVATFSFRKGIFSSRETLLVNWYDNFGLEIYIYNRGTKPIITGLSPSSVYAGSGTFDLLVNGINFVNGSTMLWNGSPRETFFISSTQLRATISSESITAPGVVNISVTNPSGEGTSSTLPLTILSSSTNPVPSLSSITPSAVFAGSTTLTLTLSGSNFIAGSKVRWNGADRTTSYVSATQLTATIPASDLASVGTASVTVFNPTPGGGVSAALPFTIKPADENARWTFLLYLAGDTAKIDGGGVHSALVRSLQNLENRSNNQVNVVALIDGPASLDTFRVTFDPQANYQPLGEKRMDDPATLVEFVQAARRDFPADYYYLVIADHANGVQGIAWDTTTNVNRSAYLTPSEIRQAMSAITNNGAAPIDIVHFDGCSFGLLENAYALKDMADYLVASENIGWSIFGYDLYRSLVTANTSPKELSIGIAQTYASRVGEQRLPYTISALDLSRLGSVTAALNTFANRLTNFAIANKDNRSLLVSVRSFTQKFESGSTPAMEINADDTYVDLADFAMRVKQQVSDGEIDSAADAVYATLKGSQPLVVYESHRSASFDYYGETHMWNLDGAYGVSIYYPPKSAGATFSDYTTGSLYPNFFADTTWHTYLLAGVPPLAPGDPIPYDAPQPLGPLSSLTNTVFLPIAQR